MLIDGDLSLEISCDIVRREEYIESIVRTIEPGDSLKGTVGDLKG